ncbi:MAG: hypothetical protein KGJ13_02070 [Patescibacteria group bacterium]|nr:hypothetical protein [Patescibacteria group bacterium]
MIRRFWYWLVGKNMPPCVCGHPKDKHDPYCWTWVDGVYSYQKELCACRKYHPDWNSRKPLLDQAQATIDELVKK